MPKGSNWIRVEKRHAFYERDDYRCVYCQCAVHLSAQVRYKGQTYADDSATLDHLQPPRRGGSNDVPNIVTACRRCNNEKNTKTFHQYLMYLYPSDTARREEERKRIRRLARRSVKKVLRRLRAEEQERRAASHAVQRHMEDEGDPPF